MSLGTNAVVITRVHCDYEFGVMGLQKSMYSEKYLSFNEERGLLAYINQPAINACLL